MLYHLFYGHLHGLFSGFNIFQYISFRAGGALLTALLMSLIFGPYWIKKIKNMKLLQTIRNDGPQTHLAKSGTPTMGGIIILFSLITATLLWARWDNRFVWLILIATVYLGILGFLDDYLKLVRKNPRGLIAKWKLAAQMVLAIGITAYLYLYPPNSNYTTQVNVPYLKEYFLELGIFYLFAVMLIIVGSSNAVNLTDGLDGLAIGVASIASATYAVFTYFAGNIKFASYLKVVYVPGAGELVVFLAALIGAGLGFLWFNSYPAEIFMGDTGSLFLGGIMGVIAVCIKQEIILLLITGVFLIEILSVIIQVISFRSTGKRVFKMAPLHHHFELSGWAEPKVIIRFWIVAIVLCLVAFGSLKIR